MPLKTIQINEIFVVNKNKTQNLEPRKKIQFTYSVDKHIPFSEALLKYLWKR